MKPRILLSCQSNMQNYINAVNELGGIAIAEYLPDVNTDYEGLILCGGSDINPALYGEEINGSRRIDNERDKSELALLDAFVKAGKPVMGICRGMQMINVYFGGSLYQHLDTADSHYLQQGGDSVHEVTAINGSTASLLYGDVFCVNSRHHQSVKVLGKELFVTMISKVDNVIEGIEHARFPVIATQWHPERMCFDNRRDDTVDGAKIIGHFVRMCTK